MTLTDFEKTSVVQAKARGEECPLCLGAERLFVNDAHQTSAGRRARGDEITVRLRPVPCFCTTLEPAPTPAAAGTEGVTACVPAEPSPLSRGATGRMAA